MGGSLTKMDETKVAASMTDFRKKYGSDVIVFAMKDQNNPGKLCLSGDISKELCDDISACIATDPENDGLKVEHDKYDGAYTIVWRHANLTTGHSITSLQKNYFPKGKLWVKFFAVLAKHGWSLTAAPNCGGVEARDDKGNVTSTVDWPCFIFYKDKPGINRYTEEHLLLAVKDSNIPGKLCAAGDVGQLETLITDSLNELKVSSDAVECKKDKYDEDFDAVWRNTSITTGSKVLSLEKAYFPRGQVIITILETVYSQGWRLIACPNFGGRGDSWPAFVFRKLSNPKETPPALLLAALKDSNVPGKLCLHGSTKIIVEPLVASMRKVEKNQDAEVKKDDYDNDFDVVIHNVNITTGHQAFSLKVPYFPRAEPMTAMLETFAEHGFVNVGCPNFGGMNDSWPTWVLEQTGARRAPPMFWAVKDDNIPGKINFVGGGIKDDPTLSKEILDILQILNGPDVALTKDGYDANYDLCFKHTFFTSGNANMSFTKPFFPHGCVLEAISQLLYKHGWVVCACPNFGDNGQSWPAFVCQPTSVMGAPNAPPPSYEQAISDTTDENFEI